MGIIEELERKRDVDGLISIVRKCRIDSGEAAEALGRLKDKRAVEPLIESIDSGYGGLMWGAISALGQIKDKRAVEPLVSALGDQDLASDASEALREILGGEAVEVFINVLEGEAQDIRKDLRGVVARCSAAYY